MSITLAHRDQCDKTGNWTLVRRTLGLRTFGINVVDIAPGEQLPEHDETKRDQEELFYALGGEPTLIADGEEYPLPAGTFARVDPEHTRTVRNDSAQTASVLIASAPTTSGYQPMDWA